MASAGKWLESIWQRVPTRWQEHLQNNFIQRCIAGTLLVLVSLWAIWFAPPTFFALYVWLFILLAVREWQRMTEPYNWQESVHYLYGAAMLIAIVQMLFGTVAAAVLVFVLPLMLWLVAANINLARPLWFACSVIYLSLPALSLIYMHQHYTIGAAAVTYFFIVIWATDTAAYIIGKRMGGPLLAPDVSPRKTWSGFFGGLAAGTVAGLIAGLIFESDGIFQTLLLSLLISATAQLSDLAQSWMKRFYQVKDSGGLIPGHGGVLDRIDSMMLSAPLLVVIQLFAERPLPW